MKRPGDWPEVNDPFVNTTSSLSKFDLKLNEIKQRQLEARKFAQWLADGKAK